jgi:hypothetical protein
MNTLEIDSILDAAYHEAAGIAAYQIRRHLRPFNLKRHRLHHSSEGLVVGTAPVYELTSHSWPIVQALHEAARFAASLPDGVKARLDDHL